MLSSLKFADYKISGCCWVYLTGASSTFDDCLNGDSSYFDCNLTGSSSACDNCWFLFKVSYLMGIYSIDLAL